MPVERDAGEAAYEAWRSSLIGHWKTWKRLNQTDEQAGFLAGYDLGHAYATTAAQARVKRLEEALRQAAVELTEAAKIIEGYGGLPRTAMLFTAAAATIAAHLEANP